MLSKINNLVSNLLTPSQEVSYYKMTTQHSHVLLAESSPLRHEKVLSV